MLSSKHNYDDLYDDIIPIVRQSLAWPAVIRLSSLPDCQTYSYCQLDYQFLVFMPALDTTGTDRWANFGKDKSNRWAKVD